MQESCFQCSNYCAVAFVVNYRRLELMCVNMSLCANAVLGSADVVSHDCLYIDMLDLFVILRFSLDVFVAFLCQIA